MPEASGSVVASFVAAFLGGLLALLAPCSALLLPAFFAYAFTNRTALVRGSLLFLAGLCCVLLPLGLAASLAGRLLIEQRQATILIAGSILVALGLWLGFGRGSVSIVPRSVVQRFDAPTRHTATFATGLVYGLTGFCSGPLLGGVLTVAAAAQDLALGVLLLVVYALGMVAPLLVLAAAWDRYELGRQRWLRVSVGRGNLVGGVLFVALGASFIASQGGLLLSGAYDDLGLSALGARVQDWLASTL
ncbi:MAG TPA: cytochrome c biogenesis protein CcdA [Chloroflexota bacterium]